MPKPSQLCCAVFIDVTLFFCFVPMMITINNANDEAWHSKCCY